MKYLLITLVVIICAGLPISAEQDPNCLYENFIILFSEEQQAFIYNIQKIVESKVGCMKEQWKDMDQHGDNVLAVWAQCQACEGPPCRAPFLPEIVRGSQQMTAKLQEFMACTKAEGTDKEIEKIKKEVDTALADNKKALNC